MPKHPSSGKYAIVGLGVIAGNQPDKSERMIAAEAARLAIEDAGLTRQDITGATCAVRAAAATAPRIRTRSRAFWA